MFYAAVDFIGKVNPNLNIKVKQWYKYIVKHHD